VAHASQEFSAMEDEQGLKTDECFQVLEAAVIGVWPEIQTQIQDPFFDKNQHLVSLHCVGMMSI
jgi:hypothetical protein